MADVQLVEGLMAELHPYLPRAGLVALVHQQFNEPGLVELAADDDVLSLFDVDAHAGDQLRIVAKYGLLHICLLKKDLSILMPSHGSGFKAP